MFNMERGDQMSSYQDRVEGVLLGTAVGDALGAPYEFKPPMDPRERVVIAVWSARSKPSGAPAINENDFFAAVVRRLRQSN